jgi:hypothetical protein
MSGVLKVEIEGFEANAPELRVEQMAGERIGTTLGQRSPAAIWWCWAWCAASVRLLMAGIAKHC